MSRGKKPSRVCGILVIDKPAGWTSHDVVNRIRRLYDTTEAGHTGTLDPMATGVLPVLLGRAVKASDDAVSDVKSYEAEMLLGVTTDTEDTTGTILTRSDRLPEEDEVQRAATSLRGVHLQTPPMYSALKVNGQKLYALARRGRVVERTPRPVTIHSLTAEMVSQARYRLKVTCSKGTYIRTLCADLGGMLGCGAAMASLRRTASGCLTLESAVTLETLAAMSPEERMALPMPVETLYRDLPAVSLPPFYEKLFRSGCEIYLSKIGTEFPAGTRLRVFAGDVMFAVGSVRDYPDGPALKSDRLFVL